VPRPLGQGCFEIQERKGRESNPQGSSLGRFRDGCHHQLACPSFLYRSPSTGGRNRTCEVLLNREADEPAHPSPVMIDRSKCPAGVEPARPPWQGGRLPLHHGHIGITEAELSKTRGHRVGLEPTLPRYEGGLFAARGPVRMSGWLDSNQRSPAPKAGGLPGFPTSRTNDRNQGADDDP
jgi:hypothetical protein